MDKAVVYYGTVILVFFNCVWLMPVQESDVTFLFHNRLNPDLPINLDERNLTMIDNIKSTIFICHGWLDAANTSWVVKMVGEYLFKEDYNIISVDWAKFSSKDALTAAGAVKDVGKIIGNLIVKIHANGMPLKQIRIIGHSFGGQIAGFAGREVIAKTNSKISRITGLDPTGMLYESLLVREKLTKQDAEQVDIVHTDGGRIGLLRPHGTVDFYPNGGEGLQPGCAQQIEKFTRNFGDLVGSVACSHDKSHDLFLDSINSYDFYATKCDSWPNFLLGVCKHNEKIAFGENCPSNASGSYFLLTNDRAPYHNVFENFL